MQQSAACNLLNLQRFGDLQKLSNKLISLRFVKRISINEKSLFLAFG